MNVWGRLGASLTAAVIGSAVIGTGAAGQAETAEAASVDKLFYNGKLVTVDEQFSIKEAVAVKDGIIVAVGSTPHLQQQFEADQEINLEGKTMLPGFNDAHQHPRVVDHRSVGDLADVQSVDELKTVVAAKAEELGPNVWIVGRGWSEQRLGRYPTRYDLDEAAPENPVFLTRQGSHSSVADSQALGIASITEDTPDPEGGEIVRDEDGVPTGVLLEEAQDLVGEEIPKLSPQEYRSGLAAGLKDLLTHGITSSNGTLPADRYSDWKQTYKEQGADLPRVSGYLHVSPHWPEDAAEKLSELGVQPFEGDNRLRLTAIKLHVDGGFTGRSAYLSLPYKGEKEYRGRLVKSREELVSITRQLNSAGWPVGVHTTGDAGAALMIDIFSEVLTGTPRADIRHHLMHMEVKPSEETLDTMASFGIGLAQQTNFNWSLEGLYDDTLVDELRDKVNPAASLTKRGIPFANSSDQIPTDPMLGLFTSITREGESGEKYGWPEERLSVEEAIRAYTMGGAWMTHQEDVKGSLEAGKLADMIVLSNDPMSVRPQKCLLDVEVLQTYVGGKLVYEQSPDDIGQPEHCPHPM